MVTELDIICFVRIDCNLITMNKFGDLMLTRLDRTSYPFFEGDCGDLMLTRLDRTSYPLFEGDTWFYTSYFFCG